MRSFLGLMLAVSLVVASYRPNRPAAAIAERNAAVRVVMERLNYARNEVARRYLDGDLDAAGAKAAMGRYLAPDSGPGGQDAAVHRDLSELRDQLQSGAGSRGGVGGRFHHEDTEETRRLHGANDNHLLFSVAVLREHRVSEVNSSTGIVLAMGAIREPR